MNRILYLIMAITLAGCSGAASTGVAVSSSSSSGGVQIVGPSFFLADDYDLNENKIFSLSVQAGGAEPMRYKFSDTPDTEFFNLDESSGRLTSKVPFNFEKPPARNSDNTYTLTLVAIDSNNRSASKNIKIHVKDVPEHDIAIDFPVDGANMAAGATKIHVRGHITEDGQKLTKIPSNLTILVNNQVVSIDPSAPDRWMVEIPLKESESLVRVDLNNNNVTERTKTLNIKNRPIPSYKVSDGRNPFVVEVDISKTKLTQRSLPDVGTYSLLGTAGVAPFKACKNFFAPELNSSGTQVALLCAAPNAVAYILFTCDLSSRICSEQGSFPRLDVIRVAWIKDQFLIVTPSYSQFSLIDTVAKTQKTLTLDVYDIINFDAGDSRVYASIESINLIAGRLDQKRISFEINDYIVNPGALQPIVNVRLEQQVATSPDARVGVFDGVLYEIDNNGLGKRNLAENTYTNIRVAGLEFTPDNLPRIVYAGNHMMVLAAGENLIRYNTATDESYIMESGANFYGAAYLDISPDSRKLMLFNRETYQYGQYDLESNKLDGLSPITALIDDSTYHYDNLAVDWSSKQIYLSRVFQWGGIIPSEQAHIVGFDQDTKQEYPILTGNQFARFLGYSDFYLRIGHITVDPKTHDIWYSALLFIHSPDLPTTYKQFICAINPASKAIKTIKEFPVSPIMEDIYMSRFNVAGGGVGIGHWAVNATNGGGVDSLSGSGQIQPLLPPQSPYFSTLRGVFNTEGTQLFNVGHFIPEGGDFPDFGRGELFAIDLASKTKKVIASATVGYGLTPGSLEAVYDGRRNLLIDYTYNQLWLMDVVSGDRVFVPIKSPKN